MSKLGLNAVDSTADFFDVIPRMKVVTRAQTPLDGPLKVYSEACSNDGISCALLQHLEVSQAFASVQLLLHPQ